MGKVEALAEGAPDNVVKRLSGMKALKNLTKSLIQYASINSTEMLKKLVKNNTNRLIHLSRKLTESLIDHFGVFAFVSCAH
ncbi:hypothetical protein [Serratia fonticola]|uniref:hypothetical protein n=1 Tax=Serratia fonticola TaxID=47917 RepID=UPI002DBEDD09|nr:hypothetical protein [Serratia fonticola]MEB7886246.1 hypothetical protein [Serratia fonticola]